jgi:ABC-type multidrug transport system fused ATPase/permease subunit
MPTLIGEYFSTISGAIGEKFSNIVTTIATFVFGIGIGLFEGPVYACICIAFFPIMFLVVALLGRSLKKSAAMKLE